MKKFLSLMLTLVMAASLVGCGAKEEAPAASAPAASAPAASAPAEAKPFEGTKLRVILAGHDWTNAVQGRLGEFEDLTGIELEFESYPEDQLSTKLNVELASGGQYIDVFMCRPLQEVQQFIQNGYLADVSDLMADAEFQGDDFITAAADSYKQSGADDGVYYGVPLVTERQVLYYRKDLLEAKGIAVPTTLDELKAAAAALHDPANGVVGFVGRGLANAAVTTEVTYSVYDVNQDGTVNQLDITRAQRFFGKSDDLADVDNSGEVDITDLVLILNNYSK